MSEQKTLEEKQKATADKALARMSGLLSTPRKRTEEIEPSFQLQQGEKITSARVADLLPLPENSRIPQLTADRLEALEKSIRENGIRTPLIADQSGVVVCGNNRLAVAQKIGLDSVPVVYRTIAKEDRFHYAVRDNVERRQLSPAEIDLILEEFFKDIPEQLEKQKREKAHAARSGKSGSPTGSVWEKKVQEVHRKTGIKKTAEALRKTYERKHKKPQISREISETDKCPFKELKAPIFDKKALKITVYLPHEKEFQKWIKNLDVVYPKWVKERKKK